MWSESRMENDKAMEPGRLLDLAMAGLLHSFPFQPPYAHERR